MRVAAATKQFRAWGLEQITTPEVAAATGLKDQGTTGSPLPDLNRQILTQLVQAVLQAGQGRQIRSLHIGEVRAGVVAFDHEPALSAEALCQFRILQPKLFQISFPFIR